MIPSGKSSKWFVPASALIGLLWISGALAQESTGGATPTLGEVARHQRQQPKTAKLVIGDDDIPSSHTHRITGMAGTTKMIPYITFTGLVPDVHYGKHSAGPEAENPCSIRTPSRGILL